MAHEENQPKLATLKGSGILKGKDREELARALGDALTPCTGPGQEGGPFILGPDDCM